MNSPFPSHCHTVRGLHPISGRSNVPSALARKSKARILSRSAALLAGVAVMLAALTAHAQTRPYIGFVYPAGGQQGTTFRVKLGGQAMDDVDRVLLTGAGVTARVLEYNRVIGPQEITLLNEQLRDLKRARTNTTAPAMAGGPMMAMAMENPMMMMGEAKAAAPAMGECGAGLSLPERIEKRVAAYVNRPASAALASILYIEVTVASNAPPGERELRIMTPRGISNPMAFHVGQLPETCRKPMLTASYQVLGKEELALRKRPTNEVEMRITLPCTMNGQVASGEQNRYRFSAKKGQRLVITTLARQLIPFIADAVPGWFQPVLSLYDSKGKEAAYNDDFRFKPDPALLFEVPKDGEYVLAIYDAIYRGREDFVYRISIGEMPFMTSIFPLGARTNATVSIKAKGWNLPGDSVEPPLDDSPGVHSVIATRDSFVSNPVPFAIDTLPEILETEGNNTPVRAQPVPVPTIINGRIEFRDDWDVYKIQGHAGETIVAEVQARRLDSPLDSILKFTDAAGKLLAVNDDREDPGSGINTHHADSYLMARLPKDGIYYIHVGDTSRAGGPEYGYRLRISNPQPDFALRVVPSSISMRSSNAAVVTVYAIRKDGFTNAIKLALGGSGPGFTAAPAWISGTQTMARLSIKTSLRATEGPVMLSVQGTAKLKDRELSHVAVPAEDRMQAFFWRHLVPAADLQAMVFDPARQPVPKHIPPPLSAFTNLIAAAVATNAAATNSAGSTNAVAKPKFSKQQVAGRLRQLKLLYEDGLLTDQFYAERVAECEALR